MPYLEDHGSKLIQNGYHIIPIEPGGKRPAIKKWSQIRATHQIYKRWISKGFREYGVGILAEHCPGIDLDIRDQELVDKLHRWCQDNLGATIHRIGQPPKILIPCQTDEPFTKMYSNAYRDYLGDKQQIEILGRGQQYVCFHIHPDTKKPYEWPNGSILDTPRDQLPVLTREKATQLIEYFHSVVPPDWELKSEQGEKQEPIMIMDPLENLKPPLKMTHEDVAKCLRFIDPDEDYDQWVKVGFALHHQFKGSDEGFAFWDEWSQEGPKYKDGECRSMWPGLKANLATTNPTTMATVKQIANKNPEQKKFEKSKVKLFDISQVRDKLGPITWIVKNYIEKNTLGILFGDPGSYKSFLTLDIALNVAMGTSWHGNQTKRGPVIYVAGEGFGGLSRRVCAWEKETGNKLPNGSVFFTEKSVDFQDEDSVLDLDQAIELVSPGDPELVVLDTVARCFGGGDENSTTDMNTFIDHVDRLIRAKYKCSVLLVHHTGHANKERARGSMALTGAIDFGYRVKKLCNLSVEFKNTKMKDAEPPQTTYFDGKSIFIGFGDDDKEETSLVFSQVNQPCKEEPEITGNVKIVYTLINNLADGGSVDRKKLNEAGIKAGLNKEQIRKKLAELENKGLIMRTRTSVCPTDVFMRDLKKTERNEKC
jgi:hypothetical protein